MIRAHNSDRSDRSDDDFDESNCDSRSLTPNRANESSTYTSDNDDGNYDNLLWSDEEIIINLEQPVS
jgi:hypothetical protein